MARLLAFAGALVAALMALYGLGVDPWHDSPERVPVIELDGTYGGPQSTLAPLLARPDGPEIVPPPTVAGPRPTTAAPAAPPPTRPAPAPAPTAPSPSPVPPPPPPPGDDGGGADDGADDNGASAPDDDGTEDG